MNAVERFESFLEGLVEGSFLRLFRSRLQPVDLAKRLERTMEAEKRITWSRPLVPNQFQIALSQQDLADVTGYAALLQRELAQFVAERAVERGFHLPGQVTVDLAADPSLPAGVFHVAGSFVAAQQSGASFGMPSHAGASAGAVRGVRNTQRPAPDPSSDVGHTRPLSAAAPAAAEAAGTTPVLVALDLAGAGAPTAPHRLVSGETRVGRGLDNNLIVADPSVSRHHAVVEWAAGQYRVRDLGSTNGTWINGRRVIPPRRWLAVAPGDTVAFGAVTYLLQSET